MRLSRALLAVAIALPLIAVELASATSARASFPGSNGVIAWSKLFLTMDSEIFVMDPDGSHQRQLSHNNRVDFSPAWSADGMQLAFVSSTATDADVWVMDADGTGERNVSKDPSGPDLDPAWSPDSSRIAFYKQNFDGTGSLWVVDADGSNQVQLTDDSATNSMPAWSPDGTRIAFATNRDGNFEIYLINPDGTGLTRLTRTGTQHEENPNWSPDGKRIAYDACVSASFPCPGSPNYEIWAMRANGTGKHRLTNDPTIDWNPAWSPDGTQIVFRSDRSPDGTELYKMNADGSNVVELTFGPFQGGVDPDWQPLP